VHTTTKLNCKMFMSLLIGLFLQIFMVNNLSHMLSSELLLAIAKQLSDLLTCN